MSEMNMKILMNVKNLMNVRSTLRQIGRGSW